jgi:hypothetical protein
LRDGRRISYLPGMASGGVIQVPAAGADRFKPVRAACVGILGVSLGIAISLSLLTPSRLPAPRGSAPRTRITPPDAPTMSVKNPGPISPPISVAKSIVPDRLQNKAPERPGFQNGRVAYIRCDGLTPKSGNHSCPRDAALERAAWRILQGITTCPTANAGVGYADVRLDFKRGQNTSVRVLIPTNLKPGLIRNAVYECVGKPLTSLKTSLNPLYMIVSFQFGIGPAS